MAQKSVLTSIVRKSTIHLASPPLLILLHGEGGNENELFELFYDVDERFVVISLKAPFMQTEKRFLWFTTTRYRRDYLANPAQLEYSRQQILAEIQFSKTKYHCDDKQVYMFGFGQGGVMAMNILFTKPDLIAGVAVSNAQLLDEFSSSIISKEVLRDKSVLITHGINNQIYPIKLGRKMRYELSNFPLEIDYQEYDIGHYYSSEAIAKIKDWIKLRLDDAGVRASLPKPTYSTALVACKIFVTDLDRAIDFYSGFLGMKLVERTGKAFAFLTNNTAHHVIELQLSDRSYDPQDKISTGIHSIQFGVSDKLSFAEAYQSLKASGIEVVALDKIVCWSISFPDPDGNIVEIIWDTRKLPGKSDYWQGRELPLDEQQILDEVSKE